MTPLSADGRRTGMSALRLLQIASRSRLLLPALEQAGVDQLLPQPGVAAGAVVGYAAGVEDVERKDVVRAAHPAVPVAAGVEVAGMLERRVVAAHARRARHLDEAPLVILGNDVEVGL